MKNQFVKIIMCALLLLCTSCIPEDDNGYPHRLTFPRNGGEMSFRGNNPFSQLKFLGTPKSEIIEENGVVYVEGGWLRLTHPADNPYPNGTNFRLYVDSNNSGEKRTATIHMFFGPTYHDITIKQDK